MKVTKLLLLLAILLLTVSCSSDDISNKYEGVWNLSLVKIFNHSPNYTQTIEFSTNIMVDENCLTNSTLHLKDDNTAILKQTSNLSAGLENEF